MNTYNLMLRCDNASETEVLLVFITDDSEKAMIETSMKSFHTRTCIRFGPWSGQSDYIDIQSKTGWVLLTCPHTGHLPWAQQEWRRPVCQDLLVNWGKLSSHSWSSAHISNQIHWQLLRIALSYLNKINKYQKHFYIYSYPSILPETGHQQSKYTIWQFICYALPNLDFKLCKTWWHTF